MKELAVHEQLVKGQGRRIMNYTRRHAQFEFHKVMGQWRRAHKCLDDAHNIKFLASLRNFGNDFEMAKKQIKHCYLEKQELNKKAVKYQVLFNLPTDEMVEAGISPAMLRLKREQFKHRFLTLKKALAELENGFGF